MKTLIAALGIVLLIGSSSFAGWRVAPTVVSPYYSVGPVYAYPAPYVAYMPVAAPAPYYPYGVPMFAPTPVIVGYPAVIRARVFYPGQPVRNVVRAVVP